MISVIVVEISLTDFLLLARLVRVGDGGVLNTPVKNGSHWIHCIDVGAHFIDFKRDVVSGTSGVCFATGAVAPSAAALSTCKW